MFMGIVETIANRKRRGLIDIAVRFDGLGLVMRAMNRRFRIWRVYADTEGEMMARSVREVATAIKTFDHAAQGNAAKGVGATEIIYDRKIVVIYLIKY
jgi:hypothetical protein